jgi:hypothetical protein
VRKAVFVSALPLFLNTADAPNGVDPSVSEGAKHAITADRGAFLTTFFENFYDAEALLGTRVRHGAVHGAWTTVYGGSAIGTRGCVSAWGTDIRRDLPRGR